MSHLYRILLSWLTSGQSDVVVLLADLNLRPGLGSKSGNSSTPANTTAPPEISSHTLTGNGEID